MKTFKITVALALAAALGLPAGAAAQQSSLGSMEGAGFYRELPDPAGPGKSRATKKMLVIRAFRGDPDDSGTATYREHTPGQGRPGITLVQVDCVRVSEAADGTKTANVSGTVGNDRYYIRVIDRGEPGNRRDEYGFRQATAMEAMTQAARALLGSCGVDSMSMNTIQGGNFSIFVPPS